jgi:sec-independent protein translocase protein TatB
MFDVGFAELFLLALIGLLVLGPERLPGVARTVGGFVRKARMSWVSLRNTIESELAEADLASPIKQTKEELQQIGKELSEAANYNPEANHSITEEPDPALAKPTEEFPPTEADSDKPENV